LYLVAVILIIYSGFNIIVWSGSEERTKTSKSMILYVIVGVLIIFLAGPITEFILNILNGSSQ
jgi:type IV secretory pathway VirB2 component (pilin)